MGFLVKLDVFNDEILLKFISSYFSNIYSGI